jgi:hypothetical protein
LLAPLLLSYSNNVRAPSRSQIDWSLCGSQAKIWIDETEAEDQLGAVEPEDPLRTLGHKIRIRRRAARSTWNSP